MNIILLGKKKPAHVGFRSDIMRSVQGTQRGDNLGVLPFYLVLHPISMKIQELLISIADDDRNLCSIFLHFWNQDDGYTMGPHEELRQVVNDFS